MSVEDNVYVKVWTLWWGGERSTVYEDELINLSNHA